MTPEVPTDKLKATVAAMSLAQALDELKPAVAARPNLSVLRGVRVEAGDDTLTLDATDLDVAVRMRVSATVRRPGAALVPFELLHRIVRKLTTPAGRRLTRHAAAAGSPVTIQLVGEPASGLLHLQPEQVQVRHELRQLELADYPAVPTVSTHLVGRLTGEDLKVAAARVLPFVSTDQARPVLTAACLVVALKTLTLAATDSYRLAVLEAPLTWPAEDGEAEIRRRLGDNLNATLPGLLVPAAAVKLAARLLGGETAVNIAIDDQHGRVTLSAAEGDRELTVKLLDGEFPSYQALIPAPNGRHQATMAQADLLDMLDQVEVYTARNDPVRLVFDPAGRLAVECRQQDVGQGVGQVDLVSYTGPHAKVAFNLGYLQAALKAIGTPQVNVHFLNDRQPAVFSAATPEGDGYVHLLMPTVVPN
jgi:DNA polymerase III subunit beta